MIKNMLAGKGIVQMRKHLYRQSASTNLLKFIIERQKQ